MNRTRRRLLLSAVSAAAVLSLSACPSTSAPPQTSKNTPPSPKAKPKAVIGLALGGGASKGFAHIGVIKVLRANGIPVQVVTGTSAGSIVGSMYASGMSPDRMELEAEILGKTELVDLTLSTSGFIKGEKLQNWINRKVNNRPIQQFPLKFAAVATDFSTGKAVAFNHGNAGQAVPNVFQPVLIGGRKYVDGGLAQPVPVSAARSQGANFVIAVDISAKPTQAVSKDFLSYLDQTLNIMSISALNNELSKADVVIKPQVQDMGSVGGFDRKAEAIRQGEAAARAALPKIKAALARYQY